MGYLLGSLASSIFFFQLKRDHTKPTLANHYRLNNLLQSINHRSNFKCKMLRFHFQRKRSREGNGQIERYDSFNCVSNFGATQNTLTHIHAHSFIPFDRSMCVCPLCWKFCEKFILFCTDYVCSHVFIHFANLEHCVLACVILDNI